MTKPASVLALALVAALLGAPLVAAHGAIPPRDLETRVVQDANSAQVLDYCAAGGLSEDGAAPPLPVIPLCEGGHDLMALDLREAHGPDGTGATVPGLHARLVFRRGVPDGELTDLITFTVGGSERSLDLTTRDNTAFTSTQFTWISSNEQVPGHAAYDRQVLAFVPYTVLGVQPGDTLTDVRVTSINGGKETDVMPGTYSYQGQRVPDDAQGSAPDNGPLAYTLAGPVALVRLSANATSIEGVGQHTLAMGAVADGTALAQSGIVGVTAPEGVTAKVSQTVLLLNGTSSAVFDLVVDVAAGALAGNVTVTLTTDLGGRHQLVMPVLVPHGAGSSPPGGHDGHGPDLAPTPATSQGKDAAGLGLAPAMSLLCILFLRRRAAA